MTVLPFGEGAEVKISPIPRSVMVHARSIVASRIGAAGYKLMRSLARNMELIAKTRPGNKDVTNKRDSHATQTTTTLTTSASYKRKSISGGGMSVHSQEATLGGFPSGIDSPAYSR